MTANPITIVTIPMQRTGMVFGIANRIFAFCEDDPDLSSMDAPEILPAGSMRRGESFFGIEMLRESICYRGGTIDAPGRNF